MPDQVLLAIGGAIADLVADCTAAAILKRLAQGHRGERVTHAAQVVGLHDGVAGKARVELWCRGARKAEEIQPDPTVTALSISCR